MLSDITGDTAGRAMRYRTGLRMAMAFALGCASVAALAQPIGGMAPEQSGQSRPQAVAEVGGTTRALLAIQRDGTQAGPMLRVGGEQAALAYQRYLNSFRYPIPERFVGQTAGGGMVGGNGGAVGSP